MKNESLENSAFLEQNYQSGYSTMYSDDLKDEQSQSLSMHGLTDSLRPSVVYHSLYAHHNGDDIPYEKRFFLYQRSDRVIQQVNEFLSSRSYTSTTFHKSKQCWDVVILNAWAYLWCRIFFRDRPNNDDDSIVVELRLVEGDGEELHALTIQLQQKLLPFHAVGDTSLYHQWLQSMSAPEEDIYGFTNNKNTSALSLKAISTLQNTEGNVPVSEKLGAVRAILDAIEIDTFHSELINNGLIEAVLTLFRSSSGSDILDDPYLLKPYAVQILHAVLHTIPEVRSKLAANNDFMHFLSTVIASNADILLTHILKMCKEIDDLIVLAQQRKRSLEEAPCNSTNKK
eukprot:gene11207-12499_t